ncbi:glycosyltransferase family 4 protein [Rhodopseudomonas palustris]|uniref:glycosyltransferase family 4 protein n=1 Tax=Rhodopseudomonas palustris TaxID=1076 RepID=UPI0020CD3FD5|nr:glycosyltransferase family 4 protein [Rhodopseudomonas palustris]MCP9626357.1 glycosyltransferase family 4 protein [Rhodopseudomonas palustris]
MNGSPLTLLMTADTVGGVWTYAASLARALAQRDVMVHLVTMGPPARPDQRAMISDARIELIDSELDLEWRDPGGDDVARARGLLRRIEQRVRPAVVHLNSFREAGYDWHAPTLLVAHSCVNSWSRACDDGGWLQQPHWRNYTHAVAAGLAAANAWVAPTTALRKEILAIYQPRSPSEVIWNGIDQTLAAVPPKRNFILAAGRMWDAAKNLSALAEAAAALPWPVLVAGDDSPEPASAENLVRLGRLPHAALTARMQRAAIFASPAKYEPFGLAVLEAAAAGCALVLSDIASFRELWDGAARFVPASDPQALHKALAELCADRAERERLQYAAAERARRYALTRTADAYHALYHRLVAAAARDLKVPA